MILPRLCVFSTGRQIAFPRVLGHNEPWISKLYQYSRGRDESEQEPLQETVIIK